MSDELFQWWITDSAGKQRLTGVLMTRQEALQRFPGARPNLSTRVVAAPYEVMPPVQKHHKRAA